MSRQLINRSPDLKALQDEGYEVDVKAGHLVLYNVPYVNANKEVKRGILVSVLDLAGDVTAKPSTHVAMFAGEHPCDRNGCKLKKIEHNSTKKQICDDLVVDHSFSSKPPEGYKNYHDKMTTYVNMIASHAQAVDPSATARTYAVIESDDAESVFNYIDTASSRAGITAVSAKLELRKVGIIGLGGTGSYILDLIAKTPVREIHLFDGDDFLQHNAFRAPGAATVDELKRRLKKVQYFAERYAPMRKNIVPHDFHIDASNVDQLQEMDFVFICIDRGNVKKPIVEKLEELSISFVDVGIGVVLVDEKLQGIVRVTTSTADKRDHVREKKRMGFSGGEADDVYAKDIQIADLNALNAVLAIIKWKKLFGFYSDLEREHFCAYTLDGNALDNEDKL